jgi:hypothetical protein
MTEYIVHLYREMRLSYTGIEADTPQAAATIANAKPTDAADNIEDCDGETLTALVDLGGDEDYRQSVTVDFEAERQRKAAPKLLAALEYVRATLKLRHLDEATDDEVEEALKIAQTAVAEAKAANISSTCTGDQPARFEIEHNPAENSDRVYVLVDGKFDVAIVRTPDGIVIDVYPRDGFETVATTYAFDSDVEQESSTREGISL